MRKKASKIQARPPLAMTAQATPSGAELKRFKIVEACIRLLVSRGIDGMSLEDIGKPVGMTRPQVLYYFKDKSALIDTAIHHVASNAQTFVAARIIGKSRPEDRLIEYVNANFDWAEQFPDHARMMTLFFHLCTVRPGLKELHSHIRDQGAERIEEMLLALNSKPPTAKARTQARLAARMIQDLLSGIFTGYITTEGDWSLAELRQGALHLVRTLMKET